MLTTRKLAAAFAAASLAAAPAGAGAVEAPSPKQAPAGLFSDSRSQQLLAIQILLDRAKHSPGVIDGKRGGNTRRAILAYQKANGLAATGQASSQLLDHLTQAHGSDLFQTYTISSSDVAGPFQQVPADMPGQAKLDKVGYESPAELLAEKFHMAESFLRALNPGADFGTAGTEIQVVKAGDESLQATVKRIEVDKAQSEVRAFDSSGNLVATYPTTVGSSVHPSPNDTLEVLAVAPDPTYHFDPEGRDWGPDEKLTIPAGPNNPVGVVWIDLSRDGFGIHGTPEPKLIGKTSSHGCVRLTNWDARELGKAVEKGTTVTFV